MQNPVLSEPMPTYQYLPHLQSPDPFFKFYNYCHDCHSKRHYYNIETDITTKNTLGIHSFTSKLNIKLTTINTLIRFQNNNNPSTQFPIKLKHDSSPAKINNAFPPPTSSKHG